jgi:hypothetical protein
MSADTLALYAGVILSLLFGYVPGLSDWFATLDGVKKRLLMAGLLLLVALGVVGLACSGYGSIFGVPVTCDQAGIAGMIRAFVEAMIANQATYAISASGRKRNK